jgi:nitrous oxide reductase accessory protein NosL
MLRTILITAILIVTCSLSAGAETIKCSECGMIVDVNSHFTAKIVQGDTTLYFCDIGDLFSYLNRKGLNNAGAKVKDYATGEWIDANKASYVRAEKKFMTPMGWGIAAFKDRNRAGESGSAMDFDAMAKTVK